MNDHGFEQMIHNPTREKNALDLILTTLPGQFQDVHSPDKLSDHARHRLRNLLENFHTSNKETAEKNVSISAR